MAAWLGSLTVQLGGLGSLAGLGKLGGLDRLGGLGRLEGLGRLGDLAGWILGLAGSQGNGWTNIPLDEWMENLPILQDFVPIGATAQKEYLDLSASQPGLPFSQPGLLTLSPIRVAAPLQFKYKQKIV